MLSPAFVPAKNQYIEHLLRTMKIAQINAPRIAVQAWNYFLHSDTRGRMVLGLFASALTALLVWALVGIAAGMVPLVCLPVRLLKSTTRGWPAP